LRRGDIEEGEQAAVRVGIEGRIYLGSLVERGYLRERAVGSDLYSVDRTRPLRDDSLERSAHRELGRRGKLGQTAQHERGRGCRIAMRKTADRGCDP
jgi:hypothetical protein